MEYIKRHAEATANMLSKMFGAILVAGPRQVGKTTMLQRITAHVDFSMFYNNLCTAFLHFRTSLSVSFSIFNILP